MQKIYRQKLMKWDHSLWQMRWKIITHLTFCAKKHGTCRITHLRQVKFLSLSSQFIFTFFIWCLVQEWSYMDVLLNIFYQKIISQIQVK